jgi:glycosyltransferase involved in cell wall biosynthesis
MPPREQVPRVGFVLEQTLGHITHAANLQTLLPQDPRIEAVFAPVAYPAPGFAGKLPGYRNWTVRAGLRARWQIAKLRRKGRIDALFVHTQVPAILLPDVMRRTATVVSLDATPLQYDELGAHYGHATGSRRAEDVKWRLNRACFDRAAAIVSWAEWTKQGLVDRYAVPPDKVTVIPPGVDTARWAAAAAGHRQRDDGPMRVLFVGGDFERKGGNELLAAVALLREEGTELEVDVVTRDEVAGQPGVTVHHGVGPNSERLIELYAVADVFCLPTHGDCLPMVLSEAGALGLPLVATDVGAISEIVRHEQTGLLVPVGDVAALTATLGRLAADRRLRRQLGQAPRPRPRRPTRRAALHHLEPCRRRRAAPRRSRGSRRS